MCRRRSPSRVKTGRVTVRGRDPRALLSAVLQRVQPEVGHVGGFGVAEDPEDAALVLEFVQHRRFPRSSYPSMKRSGMAVDQMRSASSIATSSAVRPPTATRS